MCGTNETSVGVAIRNSLQDLVHRMQSGQPIPVTEMRRVVCPDGTVMIVSDEKEIAFSNEEDKNGNT